MLCNCGEGLAVFPPYRPNENISVESDPTYRPSTLKQKKTLNRNRMIVKNPPGSALLMWFTMFYKTVEWKITKIYYNLMPYKVS